MELYILELPVISDCFAGCIRMSGIIATDFGASHSLKDLSAGRGGTGDDVQVRMAPMRRHLPSAGTGIIGGAHGL